jgi:histone deacetylase complex regulatory component SIN3
MNLSSQDIKIHVSIYGYVFEVGGQKITIYDNIPCLDISLLANLTYQITHFVEHIQPKHPNANLKYRTSIYCDMAELHIEQENEQNICIYTHFFDGSEKQEVICEAKEFYREFLKTTNLYLQQIVNDENLLKTYQTFSQEKSVYEDYENYLQKLNYSLEKYYKQKF